MNLLSHLHLVPTIQFLFFSPENFTAQSTVLMTLKEKAFENIVVNKGENADNKHFLLFLQCFLSNQKQKSTYDVNTTCHLQMLLVSWSPKFCHLVKSQGNTYFVG